MRLQLALGYLQAGLGLACAAGPLLAVEIERHGVPLLAPEGYFDACVSHIQNEISMPINHQQGCYCDRTEMHSPAWYYTSYHPCDAPRKWAQIGTAEANCRDHDSSWLAVPSPACRAAGADNGDSFYRYSNCRFVRSADPGWTDFEDALKQFRDGIAPLPGPPVRIDVEAPPLP